MSRVVGYHISNTLIANSDGEVCRQAPFLDFLLEPKKDTIKIFYYLIQDVANLAVLCKMNEQEVKLVHESNQAKVTIGNYKIRYVKDRFLNLQKGFYGSSPYVYIYDAHQYADCEALENETEEQTLEKAKQAQQVGEEVYFAFKELGLETDRLVSPVRALEDKVLSKLSLPKFSEIPEEAGYFSYDACCGNWLEAFQLGHFDKVWDYDISSAYPAQIMNLLDLRKGHWVQDNQYIKEAVYGYCDGTVDMWAKFHPVIFRAGDRGELPQNYTPNGKWQTRINKIMIDYITLRDMGSYKIDNGWWWIPNAGVKQIKPFEGTIKWLYGEKEVANGIKKEQIKRMMSGIYGKQLEARDNSFGEMFNPVYGCEIETGTRIEVCEFVLNNNLENDVIHIAVDGVVSSKEANIQESKEIGSWRLSNISPCICAGTGNVALRDDIDKDFHLEYDKVKKLIEENPSKSEYKLSKKTPITIAEAVNGYGIEKLGKLKEISKYINIGEVDKRSYREKPKNGGDLLSRNYQSEPIDVSLVQEL